MSFPDVHCLTKPLPDNEDYKLAELQEMIGGLIEVIDCGDIIPNHIVVVDEEGLLKHLPLNKLATLLLGRPIHGPALFIPSRCLK